MPLVIRPEEPADYPAISQVNRLAFSGDAESRLVSRLREQGFARLSLVAELDGRVVGHILFSELAIVTAGGTIAALALAPMAVLPQLQSQGIGSALVRRGLDLCRQQGHTIVIVLGHRHYYPRFGFSPELALPLASAYAGESFMALELVPGALRGITGRVEYPRAFEEL